MKTYFSANTGGFIRSFFDGVTFGAFADEGIFTESEKAERESNRLTIQRASIISRYETATYYRNVSVILIVGSLIVGFVIKRKASIRSGKFAGARIIDV